METPNSENNKRKNGSVGWKIAGATLLLLLLVAAAARVVGGVSLAGLTGKDETAAEPEPEYFYELDADAVHDMRAFGTGVVLLTDTELVYLDLSGEAAVSARHTYRSPALAVCDKTVLVYARGDTDYRLEKNGAVYRELTANAALLTAAVGKKGNYAIATLADGGYQSRLYVNNAAGEKQFEWGSARDMIVCVALSDDGKSAAVALVGSENAVYYSKVVLFAFNSNEPVATFTYSDTTVYALSFLRNNTLAVAADSFVGYISGGQQTQLLSFDASALRASTAVGGQAFALLLNASYDSDSEQLLYLWDGKGMCKADGVPVDSGMELLGDAGKSVAVVGGKAVVGYTADGTQSGTVSIAHNARRVAVSGKKVFCLTDGGIFLCVLRT